MKECEKESTISGAFFGITSSVILTIGTLVGLGIASELKAVVIAAILTIAFADAFADGLSMHMSEESRKSKNKQVWLATFSTFGAKLISSLTFIIPLVLFDLLVAVIVSVVWGMLVLSALSYSMAKKRKDNPLHTIIEHLGIGLCVIVVSFIVGELIRVCCL